MPFQKGHPKYGGKKPFTKCKITRETAALLDSLQCNPIEGMARIASDITVDINIRARMYAELAKYVAPKLTSIELTGTMLAEVEMNVHTASGRLASRITSLASRAAAE